MFNIKKHVAGTEGTHNYVVVAESKSGLVAVRLVAGSTFRVRVEPTSADAAKTVATSLSRESGWKQPGDQGQDRFSIVAKGGEKLREAVVKAVEAIGAAEPETVSDVEGELAAIVVVGTTSRDELIERVRATKVPGSAGASKWTTTTLVAKLAAGPDAEHDTLAAHLKAVKLPGANLAKTWALSVLRRKALAAA